MIPLKFRPDFPEVIDSSMLSAMKACQTKCLYSYFMHYKTIYSSEHLVAGKAFAAGLEVARDWFYLKARPAAECIAEGWAECVKEYGDFEPPAGSPKTWERMAGALEYYFEAYPLGADGAKPYAFPGGKHGIEFSFVEPLPVNHPVTGQPLLLSGRADMVANAFGGLFLYDEKTTSQLGKKWLDQWDHRSQFTAYCWGLRAHGIHPTGCVVRGVAIRKEGYDTMQAVTYRADWEVERWLKETCRVLERMKKSWLANDFEHNLDGACNEYGGCSFSRPCKSMDPLKWLDQEFVRRSWDPVQRIEVNLPRLELP